MAAKRPPLLPDGVETWFGTGKPGEDIGTLPGEPC